MRKYSQSLRKKPALHCAWYNFYNKKYAGDVGERSGVSASLVRYEKYTYAEDEMADANKVTVKIYGHDYTISGDKPVEQIEGVAVYVDKTMTEISNAIGGGPVTSVAVLTALNIASEFFALRLERTGEDDEKERLKVDAEHYAQLLEQIKSEFQSYKRDTAEKLARFSELETELNAKTDLSEKLSEEKSKSEKRVEELTAQNKNLNERLRTREEGQMVSSEQNRELEDRLKEVEGNYFELQMENIRLKGDLDRYHREED
jgi:cell division protein ZapA